MATLERWRCWWKEAGCDGNADKAFYRFMPMYLDTGRWYHNAAHIEYCLDKLEDFKRCSGINMNYSAVELAIWLHDAVMDFKDTDRNERNSAELAFEIAKDAGMSSTFMRIVFDCILATAHHCGGWQKPQEALLTIDLDLMILSESPEMYQRYAEQIRKEYAPYCTDEKFVKGRIKFLAGEIASPTIYCLEDHRLQLNKRAQRNMAQEIVRLVG